MEDINADTFDEDQVRAMQVCIPHFICQLPLCRWKQPKNSVKSCMPSNVVYLL